MLQKFAETRKIPPPPTPFSVATQICIFAVVYNEIVLITRLFFHRELQQDYFFSLNNENLAERIN
jgi:hypothetical protein